jgi:sugar lactone lactonase YvrE
VTELDRLVDGLDFGEGPRWHDGRLWYSDFHQRGIFAVSVDGRREAIHENLADRPSGLGWLPDGSLLAVSMTERKVLRDDGGVLVEHADLSSLAAGHCNDMVVDSRGNAYVGNFGFDFEAGERPITTDLLLVRPDGAVSIAASDLRFPNGSVITPDGSTLIVGESFGEGYEAFTINADATLGNRRRWADTPGESPDGCTLDAEGAIWFADAGGKQVVRVLEGGEITHRVPAPMPTFACALGGEDGRTLFILCAPSARPERVAGQAAGAIYTMGVDVPHAGLP